MIFANNILVYFNTEEIQNPIINNGKANCLKQTHVSLFHFYKIELCPQISGQKVWGYFNCHYND